MKNSSNHKIITENTAKQLITLLKETPKETALKSYGVVKKPVDHIRNSQIAAGILGSSGLIIFALGVENFISSIPEVSSPLIEIGIGIFLLLISGLFLKKLL